MMKRWLQFLTFRLDRDGFAELSWRRYLGPGLIATWLVGMDPRRERRFTIEGY